MGQERGRRGRYVTGLTVVAACASAGAIWLGTAGAEGTAGIEASPARASEVTLAGVPAGALDAAGLRVVARAAPPDAISEAAARSRASDAFGGAAARDAALVDCSDPHGEELPTPRPCWAVSLAAEGVVFSGPAGTTGPPVRGAYRVVFLDALSGTFLVALEG